MSFFESPRFPDKIAVGAVGGPTFMTEIVELASGHEQRNVAWPIPRQRYSVTLLNRPKTELDELNAFIRVVRGRGHGFRFKDFVDYQVAAAAGRLGIGAVGTGLPTYQLYRRYTSAPQTDDRKISKPVAATVSVLRNSIPVTFGAGAGEIALDTTTGIVTFVADQSRSITSHTPAASHIFTLASAFSPNLAIGGRIYVAGVTGTAATLLNDIAHAVTGVASNVITTSTNTSGLTASGGTAFFYPQPTDLLTWSGEFDVPVRFDTDAMEAEIVKAAGGTTRFIWDSIPIVELRL